MKEELENDTLTNSAKLADCYHKFINGDITREEYIAQKMSINASMQKKVKKLAELLNQADEDAVKEINKELPNKYEDAYNRQGYEIETGLNISTNFDLINTDAVIASIDGSYFASYDKVANTAYNRRRISSAITEGILQGKSVQDVAKRLLPVCDGNKSSAIRNARTYINGVQNAGRLRAAKEMQNFGVKETKVWLATTDMRTRFSHRALDEERVDIDKPFSNGGMHAGDPKLPPEERYNCRCRTRIIPQGLNPDFSGRHVDINGMSYEDWKAGKEKAKKEAVAVNNNIELTEEQKKSYRLLKTWLDNDKVYQNPVKDLTGEYDTEEESIIERISGGDQTIGSCASLAFCYVANKFGLDVRDFRGGASTKAIATNINNERVMQCAGANYQKFAVESEVKDTAKILREHVEANKEYVLGAGRHMAVVRKTEDDFGQMRFQYLELQHPVDRENGWKWIESLEDTLFRRFGCAKRQRSTYGMKYKTNVKLADVDSFKMTKEFRDIMSYINTEESKQKKGRHGSTK